jgi:hypothetical protein
MGLRIFRHNLLVLLMAMAIGSGRADDVLFFGNSFTFAALAPKVRENGGVPKLVEEIAKAKGKQLSTAAVTAGGTDWSYHLAQPATEKALASKTWTWVVLQDYSTRPTSAGNIGQFMKDGETFSDRIAVNSPKAGIILYETWARPPGAFYKMKPGDVLSGPDQMMAQLHQSYGQLQKDLAAKNPDRPVRVALVGTAFAEVRALYPTITLDAIDQHHARAAGYYLAALVIYETIYHESVIGVSTQFFNGEVTIPVEEAAILQKVADQVCAGVKETTPTR